MSREIMHTGDELPLVALGTTMPRSGHGDVEEAVRLRRRRSTATAGLPASSPTATWRATCTATWLDISGRRDHDPDAEDDRAGRSAARALAILNENRSRALVVVDDGRAGRPRASPRSAARSAPPERGSTASTTSSKSCSRRDHLTRAPAGQVRPAHPPQRVAELDAATALADRLGQRRGAADELRAALVEQRLIGLRSSRAGHDLLAGKGRDQRQNEEDHDLELPGPEGERPKAPATRRRRSAPRCRSTAGRRRAGDLGDQQHEAEHHPVPWAEFRDERATCRSRRAASVARRTTPVAGGRVRARRCAPAVPSRAEDLLGDLRRCRRASRSATRPRAASARSWCWAAMPILPAPRCISARRSS